MNKFNDWFLCDTPSQAYADSVLFSLLMFTFSNPRQNELIIIIKIPPIRGIFCVSKKWREIRMWKVWKTKAFLWQHH